MSKTSITKSVLKVSIRGEDDTLISDKTYYYNATGNWRNIIFLPYNVLWKTLIVFTVICNCILVSYFLAFENQFFTSFLPLYYTFEWLYFFHTVLVLMHRFTLPYRKTKTFIPINLTMVVFDVISLLPYYEFYYLLITSSKGRNYNFAKDYLKLKVFIRLQTVYAFFSTVNNEPGLNHIFVAVLNQLVNCVMFTVCMSAMWFWVMKLTAYNWTVNMVYHHIDRESAFDWYIVCICFIRNLFAHNSSGIISATNFPETVMLATTLIAGFFLHMMIYFGRLTALYIKKFGYQFDFSSQVIMIKKLLDNWQIDTVVKKETVDYYKQFWERRMGMRNIPKAFFLLPLSMQREQCVDVFWHALRHSHFFRDVDLSFKRYMCVDMICEFYIPGEYLYKYYQPKTKLMFIVSGVVQILSQEDQVSPVMSFSSGTLLGEAMCLMCINSTINLRCATHCEVHVLELSSLCRILPNFRSIAHTLHERLQKRIILAKQLQNKALLRLKDREQKRTSIRWLKNQWRNVARCTKSTKRIVEDKHKQINPAHISKYLDLYVLSDDVELKVKAICLNSKCPFVMDPSSTLHEFCYFLVLGATITQSIFLPFIIFFRRKLTVAQYGFIYCLDVIYIFGLYLEASTALKLKNHLISNSVQIIIYKLKQITTLIDIASTFPIELVCLFADYDDHMKSFMHINRVLKIYKLFQLINLYQLNIWINFMKIRLIKYSIVFLFSIYFISCLIYGATCFKICEEFGWFQYNQNLKHKLIPHFQGIEPATPFLISLGYTVSMVLGITTNLLYAYTINDMIMETAVVSFGYYMFSFCFSELAACAILQLRSKNKNQEYLAGLRHFVVRKNIPTHLRHFMYTVVQCQWRYNNRYEITGENSIFKDLPINIKEKVVFGRIVECLKSSPLFTDIDEDAIWKIASVAKLSVLPPNTVIMREETFCPILNVILRGYCKAASSIPTDKYHGSVTQMSYGEAFPIIESLMQINTFINVTSVTFVEIITVDYVTLRVILKDLPEFYSDLNLVLEQELKKHNIILTRQKGRLPKMVSAQKSYGKGEYFVYETNEQYDTETQKYVYIKTFMNLGKWRFIRHFLMQKCFQPTKKFYIIWEITRCIVSFIQIMYAVFFITIFINNTVHNYLKRFLQIIAVIDFYIRMHCCYYNTNGILVTHPLYTAQHYFKTSFLLDFYSVLPIDDLRLNEMFGKRYHKHVYVLLCVLTRPMLFYRIFCGLSYLHDISRETRAAFFQNLKYVLLVAVILGASATLLQSTTCTLDVDNYCPNSSWIIRSIHGKDMTRLKTNLICFYVVLNILCGTTIGLFPMDTLNESKVFLLLVTLMFSMRWFVLAKITSSGVVGNTMLVQYQHNMKAFLKFTKKFNVSKELVDETVRHFEYVWKRTNGHSASAILKTFHPVLEADFSQFLYADTLKLAKAFSGVDESTLRYMSSYFAEMHFKKDAEIIRCNDVQEYIYVVYKGKVVIYVANDKLCTLTTGGMFGCLSEKSITRQTIKAIASVHVDVLAIKSSIFNNIINQYPSVKQKIGRAIFLNIEYLLPISTVRTYAVDERLSGSNIRGMAMIKGFLISSDSRWYIAYNYVVNVHLAASTSILLMTLIVGVGEFNIVKYYYIMYIFDLIFLAKIFFGFHLSYIDPESGLEVKKLSQIWRKYLKSVDEFLLDLFTCLPFELIAQFALANRIIYSVCWSNRILRFLFMIKYYNNCKNKLTVSKHLRWTHLMYTMTFLIHSMVCVWYKIACPNEMCAYREMVSLEPITFNYTLSSNPWKSFRMSYFYVLNIYTTTGLRNILPKSTLEISISICIICISQFTILALTTGFASMLVLENFLMSAYEQMVLMVIKFSVVTDLSPSLKNKSWKYFCEIWTKSNGSWMPVLIKNLPDYLRQDIMNELYMKHLLNSSMFGKTHIDFLRQLVVHLHVYVYLPDQYIVEKGDIDGSIYFIDDGEVIAYDKHGNNEIEQVVLMVGTSFGERQGYYNVPHNSSYKARFACTLLVLKRNEWLYLLKWFPASKEYIESYIKECKFNLVSYTKA